MPTESSEGSGAPGNDTGWRGRKPWPKEPNRQRAELERNVTVALSGMALIVVVVIWYDAGLRKSFAIPAMVAAGLFVGLICTAYIRYVLARIRSEENQGAIIRETARKEIDRLSSDPDSVDILKITHLQMEEYNQLAKTQAQSADRNSQIAMTLGLLILASGAVAFIALRGSSSKFALFGVGAISVIGAAFTAFITRTFMAVRESASKQFEEAIKQPTIIRLNLLAELLACKLPPKHRDAVRVEIIRNLLQQAGCLAFALPAAPSVHRHFRSHRPAIADTQDAGAAITSRLDQLLSQADQELGGTLPHQIRPAVRGPRPKLDTELATDESSET
jgi:hypothetical protein